MNRWPMLMLLAAAGIAMGLPASPARTGQADWIRAGYQASFRLEQAGRYAAAAKALAAVRNAYPGGYTVNLRLGWLAYRQGLYADSITRYGAAINTAPDSIEARLGLLLPLLALHRWADAEQAAYRIIKEDPYNYSANLRLLAALQAQGKHTLEQRIAEKMLGRYPADTRFMGALADALTALGERERATTLRRDVSILSPRAGDGGSSAP